MRECARVDVTTLTPSEFAAAYYRQRPVLLTNIPQQPEAFAAPLREDAMRKSSATVKVIGAGYAGSHAMIGEYNDGQQLSKVLAEPSRANSCTSVFDATYFRKRPKHAARFTLPAAVAGLFNVTLTLAVGAAGTGVSWHQHGHALNLVLWGRKRWYLYAETDHEGGLPCGFREDGCISSWVEQHLPRLSASEQPIVCTQEANDLLYVPHGYWHATRNLETTAAVAAQEAEGFADHLPEDGALRYLVTGEQLLGDALSSGHPEGHPSAAAARMDLERAVANRPRHHPSWNNLGVARLFGGAGVAAALTAFERATAINPLYKQGWLGLGRTLVMAAEDAGADQSSTDWQRAARALRRAATLCADDEEREGILEMVRSFGDKLKDEL